MAAIIAAGLFGCAQQATTLDRNWGRSFESARYNQILNPKAGKSLEPIEGIDGPTAERIMNDHVSGNDDSKQKSSSNIDVFTISR